MTKYIAFALCLPVILSPRLATSQSSGAPPDSSATSGVHRAPNPGNSASEGGSISVSEQGAVESSRGQPSTRAIDAPVTYSARVIDSRKADDVISLIGDAEVKFKDVTIKAGRITILWNQNTLIAERVVDSLQTNTELTADSAETAPGKGFPVFSDGKETMVGERMEYNFKTERGRILRGRTEFQDGYYQGDAVKRIDPNVFFVKNGVYSTCDLPDPHYSFKSKKMKVITGDKVVAKPVVFSLGKIPLAIFPFAMFSATEDGRQSGIILPQFGTSPVEGRYLRNLGYYWAANDYFDMRYNIDFFEKTGFLFRTHANYALRYNFRGSLSGSYTRKDFETRSERRWNLNVNHNHTIDENTNFSVNASFQSNNDFYKEFSNNLSQRLNRQIRSNATFSKKWAEGQQNLTVNLSQTTDIESGSRSTLLPRLQYRRNRSAIIPFVEDSRGPGKRNPKWFNFIQYDYTSLLTNSVRSDSTANPDVIDRRVEHDLNFSYTNPNKLFGWMSLSQSFSYDEDWFDRRRERFRFESDSTTAIISDEEKGFFARRLFNYSASASSNIYGTFSPNLFGVTALRHRMSPSISFSYRPDFSAPRWGYYETLVDSAGNEIARRDRFTGTPRGRSMTLNYGLTNLFQMKTGGGEKEKKFDLFNLDFRGGYNFAADSLKLQNLSTSFRANPRRNLNVTMNLTHSFYEFDRGVNRAIDNFRAPRLTNLRLDARWSIGRRSTAPSPAPAAPGGISPLGDVGVRAGGEYESKFDPESAFTAFDIPWRADLAFSYSLNRANPFNTSRTAYIDLRNVELQFTRNWRIGYRMRYDLERTEVVDQRISFYRDLHCWEARFDWNPSGIGQGFFFVINIKASHLRQVKVERRGGTTSVFNPF